MDDLSCRLGHGGSITFFLFCFLVLFPSYPSHHRFFVNTDIWLKNTCLHPSVAEGKRRHIVGLGTTLLPKVSQFKGSALLVALLFFPVPERAHEKPH